ncbi:hypothetical protein RE6C_01470 [Rhodopirellula europaea 6C]|uniref:Uncharacterized protein n=1 Tax=Rhodopirellula europaea 6C TaxID=1263867 RepID=M2B6I7_9BACT|nr:hypothetical protein RE6C_01470 [Rhodopirellula europaea 6C]
MHGSASRREVATTSSVTGSLRTADASNAQDLSSIWIVTGSHLNFGGSKAMSKPGNVQTLRGQTMPISMSD